MGEPERVYVQPVLRVLDPWIHALLLLAILAVLVTWGLSWWNQVQGSPRLEPTASRPGQYGDWWRDRNAWDLQHVEAERRVMNEYIETRGIRMRRLETSDDKDPRLADITAKVKEAAERVVRLESERDRLFPEPRVEGR